MVLPLILKMKLKRQKAYFCLLPQQKGQTIRKLFSLKKILFIDFWAQKTKR
jgi:hypothetical protein